MNRSLYTTLFFWLLFFHAISAPSFVIAEITEYVEKYEKTSLTPSQLSRIKQFDHYIEYFTDFYYFIPKHKVSPNFIRALILAESNAMPNAISNRGALGLGQIIHSTGKAAAKTLYNSNVTFRFIKKEKLADLKREDLFDPAINILLTCFLIAKYNYKFDGKIELVLSAWNAGENTHSLSNMQHAPYKETENLIGKVNGYYLYLLKHYK